jgi:hypothetical protein
MAVDDYALTTLAKLKQHPGMRNVPTADDAELEDLINSFSKAIRHFTGREFAPRTPTLDTDPVVERIFDYDGEGYLNLEPFEARSITTVKLYVDDNAAVTLLAGDWRPGPRHLSDEATYFFLSLREMASLKTPIPWAREFPPYGLGVSGRWGAGPKAGASGSMVPADVDRACRIAVANAYRNPEGFASRRLGEFDVVEAADVDVEGGLGALSLPRDARNLLGPYRRPRSRRRHRYSTTA